MTNLPNVSAAMRPGRPRIPHTDLSRGASQFCIRRVAVLVETSVLDRYVEIDPVGGLNTIGVILTVLSSHLAGCPGGSAVDRITICLQRRADGRLVEVDLALRPSNSADGARLLLQFETEREFAPTPTAGLQDQLAGA